MQTTQLERPAEATAERRVRELNSRMVDGLQVELLWCEADDLVFVRVEDHRSGQAFCVPVRDGQSPTEVFLHPYAYAPDTPAA